MIVTRHTFGAFAFILLACTDINKEGEGEREAGEKMGAWGWG